MSTNPARLSLLKNRYNAIKCAQRANVGQTVNDAAPFIPHAVDIARRYNVALQVAETYQRNTCVEMVLVGIA